MRTVKRNRYYCEFCKKTGGSAGHMRSHEQHCTANPNRICRMCRLLDNAPIEVSNLKSLLPQVKLDDEDWLNYENVQKLKDQVVAAFPNLRKAAENCPSCILSALRQSGCAVIVGNDLFDFKKERTALFAEFNSKNRDYQEYIC